MVAGGILGIISLVMIQVMKSQAQNSVDAKITTDLTMMKTDIQNLFSNPRNCNANFYGLTAVTNQTANAIYRCNGTGTDYCRVTPGTGTSVAKYTPVASGSNWGAERVRINSVNVSVGSLTPIAPATAILTTATVNVVFQKKPFKVTGATTETVTFTTPVVFNGTTVTGCPKSWNSTTPLQ